MPNSKNIEIVQSLTNELKARDVIVVVQLNPISANNSNKLRNGLSESGLSIKVVRKTLAKVALEDAGKSSIKDLLSGRVAFILGDNDDIVSVSKTVKKFSKKEAGELVLSGAIDKDTLYSADQLQVLADLPSREELLGKLLFLLSSPITNLVRDLNDINARFVRVLANVASQKES